MTTFFIGILSLIVGAAIVYFLTLSKNKKLEKEKDELQTSNTILAEKNRDLEKGMEEREQKIIEETNKTLHLTKELAEKDTNLQNQETRNREYKKEVEELQIKFSSEFKNLANEILEAKSKKFTEQNKINIEEILKPLGEKIKVFEQKVTDTYNIEAKERFSLEKEIQKLVQANQKISEDATNLTNALKGQTKTQGQWGEFILDGILEHSGLIKDREYFLQESYTDEHGRRKQPDVVVKYPGDKAVVIDSKVSLVAYEKYCSGEGKEQQQSALKEHLSSLRKHIDELDSKKYSELYQIKSLDFVFMFIPIEPAFLIALQTDQQMWSYAYDRHILLLSPTNLIAALKIIHSLWRQESQSKNALEIARQSGDLYDKFIGFLEDLTDIGDRLDSAQESYGKALNKIKDGKGNLISRAEKIKELGAQSKKAMPEKLLNS